MSTVQASRPNAVVATETPSATPQDKRPAAAKISPESALGAAVQKREALGVGGMLALQAAAGNRAVAGLVQARRGPAAGAERAAASPAAGGGHAGSGNPIPPAVQVQMEGALGADFSNVQVHVGSARAVELGARAFTQGSEIHVAPGQWAPETTKGQELLGH